LADCLRRSDRIRCNRARRLAFGQADSSVALLDDIQSVEFVGLAVVGRASVKPVVVWLVVG